MLLAPRHNVDVTLRAYRLRLLGRLFKPTVGLQTQDLYVALVDANVGFAKSAHDDFEWLKRHNGTKLKHPPPLKDTTSILEWLPLMLPQDWPNYVKMALRNHLQQQQELRRVESFKFKVSISLTHHGCGFPQSLPPSPVTVTRYPCYECEHVACNTAGWHAHRRLSHGIKNNWLDKCESTKCVKCGIQFHTYERLRRHIAGNNACKGHIRTLPNITDEQKAAQNTRNNARKKQTHMDLGFSVLSASLIRTLITQARTHTHQQLFFR